MSFGQTKRRIRWTDILGRPEVGEGTGMTEEQAALVNALLSINSQGLLVRGNKEWLTRSIARSGDGLRVSDGSGVSGNPVISLADDMAAIEALTQVGFLRRMGTNIWRVDAFIDWSDLANVPTLLASMGITNGSELDAIAALADSPGVVSKLGADSYALVTLATVATTGDYNDLSNLPALREVLTADRTYFVSTAGNDSNDGLTGGTPFLTIQHAIDVLSVLDAGAFDVTVDIADGTYAENIVLASPLGTGSLIMDGNTGAHANVLIGSGSGNSIFMEDFSARWTIQGVKVGSAAGGGVGVNISIGKVVLLGVDFGACGRAHVEVGRGGRCDILAAYTITGGAQWHYSSSFGVILADGFAVTLTGTPAFSSAFARASLGGQVGAYAMTFSGAATGKRYDSTLNAVLDTGGGGATYFPGTIAGTTATGGQYA